MANDKEHDFSSLTRYVIVAIVIILWVVYFGFMISAFASNTPNELVRDLFKNHMGAGVAVPLAGLSAFLLVAILEIKSGPVQFEGLGFKLRGAAGPILFWVICFLAIIGGIRLVPS